MSRSNQREHALAAAIGLTLLAFLCLAIVLGVNSNG